MGHGEKDCRRKKDLSKEAVTIIQVRENEGLNQGDNSTDSINALGHIRKSIIRNDSKALGGRSCH